MSRPRTWTNFYNRSLLDFFVGLTQKPRMLISMMMTTISMMTRKTTKIFMMKIWRMKRGPSEKSRGSTRLRTNDGRTKKKKSRKNRRLRTVRLLKMLMNRECGTKVSKLTKIQNPEVQRVSVWIWTSSGTNIFTVSRSMLTGSGWKTPKILILTGFIIWTFSSTEGWVQFSN